MPSKHEKVLLSAFQRWPEAAFTAEDLVMACWESFPDDFGLQGHEKVAPDSNVVYRHIMGQNSIVKKEKWLLQTQSKTYKVSTKGAEHALDIQEARESDSPQRVRIDRAREAVLGRLLRSRAWQKHLRGEEIVFREACGFWGITPRAAGEEYRLARSELVSALELAETKLADGGGQALFIPEIGTQVEATDLSDLRILDTHLLEKFADEVVSIKERFVERGRIRYDPR